jgi:hypothetical protein
MRLGNGTAGNVTICPASIETIANNSRCRGGEHKTSQGRKHLMQMPAMLRGESLTRLFQGCAVGVIGTLAVGFTWGGWMLGSTAREMASEQSTAAVVKVLAPACVQRFQQQTDLAAKWAAYKAVDSWQRDAYIEKNGFATPIGAKSANADVADKCATMLTEILEKQGSSPATPGTPADKI